MAVATLTASGPYDHTPSLCRTCIASRSICLIRTSHALSVRDTLVFTCRRVRTDGQSAPSGRLQRDGRADRGGHRVRDGTARAAAWRVVAAACLRRSSTRAARPRPVAATSVALATARFRPAAAASANARGGRAGTRVCQGVNAGRVRCAPNAHLETPKYWPITKQMVERPPRPPPSSRTLVEKAATLRGRHFECVHRTRRARPQRAGRQRWWCRTRAA